MTWTKIGDDFCDREDLLNCSRSARLLYVELLVYGNRIEKDGRIPRSRLPRFTDSDAGALDELIAAGVVTIDAGTLVLDWADQEPSERLQNRRTGAKQRQSLRRDRMAKHIAGKHGDCPPSWDCKKSSRRDKQRDSQGGVTGEVTRPRSVPVPTQEGEGQRQPDDHADASTGCPECELRGGRHLIDCEQGQAAS